MDDDDQSLELARIESSAISLKGLVVGQGEVVVLASRICNAPIDNLGTRNVWQAVVDLVASVLLGCGKGSNDKRLNQERKQEGQHDGASDGSN